MLASLAGIELHLDSFRSFLLYEGCFNVGLVLDLEITIGATFWMVGFQIWTSAGFEQRTGVRAAFGTMLCLPNMISNYVIQL